MGDQKWNKNALGYGEKSKASSQDQWNKNALNYDPNDKLDKDCLLYTSPSPRDKRQYRMPSSA